MAISWPWISVGQEGRGDGKRSNICGFCLVLVLVFHKCSPLKTLQDNIWLDNLYIALNKNTTLNQHRQSKPLKTYFTSLDSSLRQSFLSHTDIQGDTSPLRCETLSQSWITFSDSFACHSLNDEDRAHHYIHSWAHFGLLSTFLDPSITAPLGAHTSCVASQYACEDQQSSSGEKGNVPHMYLSSLRLSKTYIPLNLEFIWISPSNIYLVSVYKQV